MSISLERLDVNSNPVDEDVQTPLLGATKDRHEGVVHRLMEPLDIDPNTVDEDGQTPRSWATDHGHEGVVTRLPASLLMGWAFVGLTRVFHWARPGSLGQAHSIASLGRAGPGSPNEPNECLTSTPSP